MITDDVVAKASGGDAEALEALLRQASTSLRTALTIDPRCRRSFDVEDVLQVTFLEAFLRIRSLEQPTVAAFHSWLRRIAENNLADAVRALGRQKRDAAARITHGSAGESSRTLLLAVAGEQSTASSRAQSAEQIGRLRTAIGALPVSYRLVVEQVDLAERAVPEVAAAMGRSEGAVHMLRARAHDRLRELLKAGVP
jgi:RNA polymerase sigma-70 factor (ECF subfamily)